VIRNVSISPKSQEFVQFILRLQFILVQFCKLFGLWLSSHPSLNITSFSRVNSSKGLRFGLTIFLVLMFLSCDGFTVFLDRHLGQLPQLRVGKIVATNPFVFKCRSPWNPFQGVPKVETIFIILRYNWLFYTHSLKCKMKFPRSYIMCKIVRDCNRNRYKIPLFSI
jgi:hypothetical protein